MITPIKLAGSGSGRAATSAQGGPHRVHCEREEKPGGNSGREPKLARDFANADAGIHLAVAGAAAEVFAAAHLLDVELVAHLLADDFGGDRGPGYLWLADLDAALAGDEQHCVEGERIAFLGAVTEVDLDLVAGGNFVLAAVGGNDGVHDRAQEIDDSCSRFGKPCNVMVGGRDVEGAELSAGRGNREKLTAEDAEQRGEVGFWVCSQRLLVNGCQDTRRVAHSVSDQHCATCRKVK